MDDVAVTAYTVPTDAPESDGTFEWDATTIVVVEIRAAGVTGTGYTYAHTAAAALIRDTLASTVLGRSALDVQAAWDAMRRQVRNIGRRGIAAGAISAVDTALWDLKARLLEVPLVTLLGARRAEVPVYASVGFTSYDVERLREQLAGWAERGFRMVKMKVGRDARADAARVAAARAAVGQDVALFVDANGAYDRKLALAMAHAFAEHDVRWFEEPVGSDDRAGLRLVRERAPAGMDIAAGEYAYDVFDFRDLILDGAIDALQADATRCCGFTGFMAAAALCEAHALPLSAHTSPLLHTHICCSAPRVVHVEYFHDHARIERLLFDGAQEPIAGTLRPDLGLAGMGFSLKRPDAEAYRVF
ncbi:MAG: enolase C-terminal domain-like protein [Longimicrobiales bacterium]